MKEFTDEGVEVWLRVSRRTALCDTVENQLTTPVCSLGPCLFPNLCCERLNADIVYQR